MIFLTQGQSWKPEIEFEMSRQKSETPPAEDKIKLVMQGRRYINEN